ncbi:glycoside hydrolase family 18 protein [Punctularia strigosozonata HHB-11173 SS5]|uniref:glycoside hydrolase family 18 protein n=1 Tax=Punctularia strigosozonata (strain HHB-11173) TaxID=741275 RepID=UPI00044184FF|nr:glycoside hydrolase family 18 protein [Punctularia strigosozonata HHB-11173 SS5]EIN11117.1 glycoside hydrolase family 18 protein [Punctularia strigosozonata HHB-11173 SS5]
MADIKNVSVVGHTTSSSPRPHVVYTIAVKREDGTSYELHKRYSEFVALHEALGDPHRLPPKRILATHFVPSAWVDDALISERKSGLGLYLSDLISSKTSSPLLDAFLSPPTTSSKRPALHPEDALPSTLSRKTALSLKEAQGEVQAAASSLIAASYYPDWAADTLAPESIDFSKFDILFFAFATPNSSSTISWDDGATGTLKRLVSAANSSGKGTKIVLSIGGWGGSYYFSQAMSTSANRTKFVNAAVSAVNTYGLAGIDIDWEYPNSSGAGNPFSSSDSANLLSFFKSLRTALGSSKIISAAVTQQPWLGSNGSPLTDVSAYAAQMTYVNIMNYDVWGASATPGPNAPLGNLCGNATQPQASAQAAFAAWTKAKMPANKLLLGLPLYGYVSKSTKTTLTKIAMPPAGFVPSIHQARPVFLNNKHERARPSTTIHAEAAAGDLSSYFGQQIAFNQIIALGALKKSGSVYVQANGYTEGWDDCSDTPFLFNTSRSTVVTYDDTYSLADKAAYAKSSGMAGCFTWSMDQDDGYSLQNVIRSSLGK